MWSFNVRGVRLIGRLRGSRIRRQALAIRRCLPPLQSVYYYSFLDESVSISSQSHKRIVPSVAALTSIVPSGENANVFTPFVCPSSAAILSPVLTSHNWIVPVSNPLTSTSPSGENTNSSAELVEGLSRLCPVLMEKSLFAVSTSHKWM